MKKAIMVLVIALLLTPAWLGAKDDDPAARETTFGKAYSTIGSFGGWTFWVGWDANFSESYDPVSESYGWVVHFAPEGVYLSLQKGKSLYSGVDVNAGFSAFYGIAYSPDGKVVKRSFIDSLSGKTFSVTNFSTGAPKIGPAANLSAGISSSVSCFSQGPQGPMQRAVQYGTGVSASYALVANPFPFSVSLGTKSGVEAGFYPIALWDLPPEEKQPRRALIKALQTLSDSQEQSFTAIHNVFMASRILQVIKPFPLNNKIDEFIEGGGDSEIDRLIKEVGEWDKSGDTKNLPENLRPEIPPQEISRLFKPLQSAVAGAFECGYKRGYDATNRKDTIYADCMRTLKGKAGSKVRIEVTRDEIVTLYPALKNANLEGVQVIFDHPPETYIATRKTETAVRIKKGRAVFSVSLANPTSALLGVRINRSRQTKNKTLELCRRLVVFE